MATIAPVAPAKLKFIDVHCHLNFPNYDADFEAVVARAREEGVGMIVVGTTKETSARAIEIAEKYENIWAIIGLHPIHAHEASEMPFDSGYYAKLAQHPKVVGIGECGYDYFRVDTSAEVLTAQHEAFVGQIGVANQVGKPLMLHLRSGAPKVSGVGVGRHSGDAYKDALRVLREFPGGLKVVGDAHFFAGSIEDMKAFVELGFYISFTGVVTFADSYSEVVKAVPVDRILSETDAPFVAPKAHRGERNEPSYVVEVAHKLAEIRGATSADSKSAFFGQLIENAGRLFGIQI
jgi:TatD DNase family protein